jgi:hypothetical protein
MRDFSGGPRAALFSVVLRAQPRFNGGMKNTLVVVTDLGSLKAYRLDNSRLLREPRLELIREFNFLEAHAKLGDKVTDQGGRFPRTMGGGQNGAMSDGERHNIALERRKRLVRQLAQSLEEMLKDKEVEICYLAASREINHQLVDELSPEIRKKIEKNIPADLTKIEKSLLLGHF